MKQQILTVDKTVNKQISGRVICQLHETVLISTLSLVILFSTVVIFKLFSFYSSSPLLFCLKCLTS